MNDGFQEVVSSISALTSIKMAQQIPRIAVVGGGIAGTLCSMVLKNRGLAPVLIDQATGRGNHQDTSTGGLGGRLRGPGAQFLRATDPRLQSVMAMLQNANVIQPWTGRFGMLGSKSGGFLPANVITSGVGSRSGGGVAGLAPADPVAASNDTTATSAAATDAGDFCHFVQYSDNTAYVGVPTMLDLCPQIATLADIATMGGTRVLGASMAAEGGWILDLDEKKDSSIEAGNTQVAQHFDAMVLATHDPSLASTIVQSIVDAEVKAGGYSSVDEAIETASSAGESDTFPLLLGRLRSLSRHLQQVRDEGRMPLYSVQFTYPPGFSNTIPFDAVSVPGSPFLQFLAREASKPGRSRDGGDVWTAISTSQLAAHVMSSESMSAEEKESHIQHVLTSELANLVSPYFGGDEAKVPAPTEVQVKRWGAALVGKGLELQEDSITLAGWRLGICGDFIRQSNAYPTPWEAAALSGLEAGERMTNILVQQEL